jgi:multidrug efflux pump subunit AcrA (membrane-fusion protein)
VTARLALLGAGLLATLAAFRLAHARDRDRALAEQSATERYVCPMHFEVVSRVPGECPICQMALERAGTARDGAEAERSGTIDTVARRVVTQLVRAPAWLTADGTVTAVVHKDDLVGLAPGERALFFGTSTPGVGTPVRLAPDPPSPWDRSTVRLRFIVDRTGAAGGTGNDKTDTGWLQLAARPRDLLVVPTSAVLYSGTGAYVLAAPPGSHTFTRRDVEPGRILDSGYGAGLVGDRFGTIVVLSGLKEGEQVIGGDAFFLDAERRLQASHGNPAEVTR